MGQGAAAAAQGAPIIRLADPLACLETEALFIASQRPSIRADVADILVKYPASVAAAGAYIANIGSHIPDRHWATRRALADAARAEFAWRGLEV